MILVQWQYYFEAVTFTKGGYGENNSCVYQRKRKVIL